MDILKIKNENGSWTSVPALIGPKGDKGEPGKDGANGKDGLPGATGPAGTDGKDYVLTEQDKQDIAQIVLGLLPNAKEVKY